MKNLVRGGMVLLLTSLFVAYIYAQTRTDTKLAIANDSQPKLNKIDINSDLVTEEANLINSNIESVTVSNPGAAKVTGINKGSFTATAYCLKGRTAMGSGVRRGIVAADPRVLRLGSRINVSAGAYSGTYLVSDTGGSVRGRKLDIWVPSCSEAMRFGRRTVGVSVIGK
jgi:3D (Asp-Asp-Asp) domain-containing protein